MMPPMACAAGALERVLGLPPPCMRESAGRWKMAHPGEGGPQLTNLQSFVERGVSQTRGQPFPWETVRAGLRLRGSEVEFPGSRPGYDPVCCISPPLSAAWLVQRPVLGKPGCRPQT